MRRLQTTFTDSKLNKIKEGMITAFIEVIQPQPKHTPMCMFQNDLVWWKDTSIACTVSNKENGPEDYYEYATYGQKGDYLHVKGVTMLITNVQVLRADKLSGIHMANIIGCTYNQWYNSDSYEDYHHLNCDETDFLFFYEIKYIQTPPMEEMIKLASACKAIAGVA